MQFPPLRIRSLDQGDLPLSVPLLNLFFSGNSRHHIICLFKVNKTSDLVPLRKAFDESGLVLVHSPLEIVRHADVERSVLLAGEYVNKVAHR